MEREKGVIAGLDLATLFAVAAAILNGGLFVAVGGFAAWTLLAAWFSPELPKYQPVVGLVLFLWLAVTHPITLVMVGVALVLAFCRMIVKMDGAQELEEMVANSGALLAKVFD